MIPGCNWYNKLWVFGTMVSHATMECDQLLLTYLLHGAESFLTS